MENQEFLLLSVRASAHKALPDDTAVFLQQWSWVLQDTAMKCNLGIGGGMGPLASNLIN